MSLMSGKRVSKKMVEKTSDVWVWINLDDGAIRVGHSDKEDAPEVSLSFQRLRIAIEKDGRGILSEYEKTKKVLED